MRRVSIASGSRLSADAGAGVADAGGNAVDAAIAATLVLLATQPGIVSLAAGAFITVWAPDGRPVVLDAYCTVPGKGLAHRSGIGGRSISMEYGGGMTTHIDYGSVATPGAVAGLGEASRKFGSLPWRELVTPAVDATRNGFPMPDSSAEYMAYAHDILYGWQPASRRALHGPDRKPLKAGETVLVDGLADALERIADHGPGEFYTGDIGHAMADDIIDRGGFVTREDLATYTVTERTPSTIRVRDWEVATNPPPAVGGVAAAALILLGTGTELSDWDAEYVRTLIRAQEAVFEYRVKHLDEDATGQAALRLLEMAELGDHRRILESPSTIHVSAVDSDGLACSITASAGYGAGAIAGDTGIWLNNCLGEVELNREPIESLDPGRTLRSNMAPTVARSVEGSVLAVGSPGASRITSALSLVLLNFIELQMSLHDAVEHPRLHVEEFGGVPAVACEPGVPIPRDFSDRKVRRFPDKSMYFGGVAAALWDPSAGLFEAADSRRAGAVARGGVEYH